MFLFFLFDLDKSGELSCAEVPAMLKQVHKEKFSEVPGLRALGKDLTRNKDGVITAKEFAERTRQNAEVCGPIASLQVRTAAVFIYFFLCCH